MTAASIEIKEHKIKQTNTIKPVGYRPKCHVAYGSGRLPELGP